ncbi:MAG: hypothetical protein CL596_03255 [Alteromonas sp.]|nr:hypothetical protein [Alteromonas sp.]MAY22312.1 hypothetical protein [Flavobacteriaceae bacterium]
MFDWWKRAFIDNYAKFDGRARRSEYWYFTLFNIIITVPLITLFVVLSDSGGTSEIVSLIFVALLGLIVLALFIPSIAVAVRRLHDTGRSGWWYIIGMIPVVSYVGSIVLLVFYCTDSQPGRNKWGPNPKKPEHNEIDQIGTE